MNCAWIVSSELCISEQSDVHVVCKDENTGAKIVLKRILIVVASVLFAAACLYVFLVWQNNKDIPGVYRSEAKISLERGIEWLWDNQDEILQENNVVLWWMLWKSAAITKDGRLGALFEKYRARYLERAPANPWSLLFKKQGWVPVRYKDIESYPYYNQYFIFALTCDAELARVPLIQAQSSPEFCGTKLLTPACVTHQLMGMRMMQEKNCSYADGLEEAISELQNKIVTELKWDPRVVDVYLQRVLMLAETKAGNRIKPVWLKRILDEQSQVDGSWSGFQPILRLWGGRWVGFSAKGLTYTVPKSNFHATIQGVFALGLLLHGDDSSASNLFNSG